MSSNSILKLSSNFFFRDKENDFDFLNMSHSPKFTRCNIFENCILVDSAILVKIFFPHTHPVKEKEKCQ